MLSQDLRNGKDTTKYSRGLSRASTNEGSNEMTTIRQRDKAEANSFVV